MDVVDYSPSRGYSSFPISQRLYELSGWDSDMDWADWLPMSEENYPGYTCGSLMRRLEQVARKIEIFINPTALAPYRIIYNDWLEMLRLDPNMVNPVTETLLRTEHHQVFLERRIEVGAVYAEDALALLCIELHERGKFAPRR